MLQCYMYLHNKSFIITKFLGLLAPARLSQDGSDIEARLSNGNLNYHPQKFLGLLALTQYVSVTRAFRVRVWLRETTVTHLLIAI